MNMEILYSVALVRSRSKEEIIIIYLQTCTTAYNILYIYIYIYEGLYSFGIIAVIL